MKWLIENDNENERRNGNIEIRKKKKKMASKWALAAKWRKSQGE
jgi:hypothetical protein